MTKKKKGDFTDEVILESYEALIRHYYLKERAVMSILSTEMRYAGPREAVFHAIIRKNFGCTHFLVGRDHAGVGNYYKPYAAHEIFEEFPDLEIIAVFFKRFFYCKRCQALANEMTSVATGEQNASDANKALQAATGAGVKGTLDGSETNVVKRRLIGG